MLLEEERFVAADSRGAGGSGRSARHEIPYRLKTRSGHVNVHTDIAKIIRDCV